MNPFSTGRLNASSPKSLQSFNSDATYVRLSRVLRAMQLGITEQLSTVVSSEPAATKPALRVYAPLSMMRVFRGGAAAAFLDPFGGIVIASVGQKSNAHGGEFVVLYKRTFAFCVCVPGRHADAGPALSIT